MKHIISIFILIVASLTAMAQTTQYGYVKTKGRLDDNGKVIPGKRLTGVSIVLTSGHSTVSDANGNFTLTIPDKKFFLSNVKKTGQYPQRQYAGVSSIGHDAAGFGCQYGV